MLYFGINHSTVFATSNNQENEAIQAAFQVEISRVTEPPIDTTLDTVIDDQDPDLPEEDSGTNTTTPVNPSNSDTPAEATRRRLVTVETQSQPQRLGTIIRNQNLGTTTATTLIQSLRTLRSALRRHLLPPEHLHVATAAASAASATLPFGSQTRSHPRSTIHRSKGTLRRRHRSIGPSRSGTPPAASAYRRLKGIATVGSLGRLLARLEVSRVGIRR